MHRQQRALQGTMTECPGCGVQLPDQHLDPPDRLNASGECFQVFSNLQGYTVAKLDPAFIHQHAVDAYEAQHAGGTDPEHHGRFWPDRAVPCAGERIYRQAGAAGAYEHRKDKRRLATAGTSRSAGIRDGHGCALCGYRC
jgi:hypothetical protein